MECCRLRVKDVDLERGQLTVRGGKAIRTVSLVTKLGFVTSSSGSSCFPAATANSEAGASKTGGYEAGVS